MSTWCLVSQKGNKKRLRVALLCSAIRIILYRKNVCVSVCAVLVAGEGTPIPGLPRSKILPPGSTPLQASNETGQ